MAEKTEETSSGRELKVCAAVKLYELGRLTSDQAAKLAEMSRAEFLTTLARFKISA